MVVVKFYDNATHVCGPYPVVMGRHINDPAVMGRHIYDVRVTAFRGLRE